ncbi:hypothetical protein Tco_1372790 [Tanacetum coccineum]
MVISSPCLTDIKNWLVQKQTTFGKDFSNLFTADSLLKTIWFLTHHASHAPCYSNEALAILEQTTIVGNQSIERDRLIGIGLVMDLVKFLSFTFGGKEMTFVVLAFLR